MKSKIIYFILGSFISSIILLIIVFSFLFFGTRTNQIYHNQVLKSGKTIKVIGCYLVWGVEHDERTENNDNFLLEFVLDPNAKENFNEIDKETLEAFELIQPISEQWGFKHASVNAFPTLERKGIYYIYSFDRDMKGKWNFKRTSVKVHNND